MALITAFFAVALLVWLRLDRQPPLWDEAHYLRASAELYDALRDGGPRVFLARFSASLGNKAPLIVALPLPFFPIWGESHHTARYVNVVCLVVASFFIFRLGERVAGRQAALLAVILTNTFPLVAGMSRQFMVELALMTLVVLWMDGLVRWRQTADARVAWLLGLVFGLGLLLKVTFPLYVAAPTLLVLLWEAGRHREHRLRRPLLALARMSVVAAPIAALWYLENWKTVLGFAWSASYGEAATGYSKGSVWSLSTVLAYWQDLVGSGVSAFAFLLLAVVAVPGVLGAFRGENRTGVRREALPLLLSWALVPGLILTFAVSKEIRFAMPYLPALALLVAAGWVRLTRRRLGGLATAAVAALAVAGFFYYSFAPRDLVELRLGRLVLVSRTLKWTRPPAPEEWPNERLLRVLDDDAASAGIPRPRATLLFSHQALNAHNMNYLATLHGSPVRFGTVSFQSPGEVPELAAQVRASSDYLLTKSASLGGAGLNVKNLAVLAMLQAEGMPFEPLGTLDLPDGSEVRVARGRGGRVRVFHAAAGESPAGLPPPADGPRFGEAIVLAHYSLRIEPDGFLLELTWRCIAEVDEDYRVFVHFIDPTRGPYSGADHVATWGRYPTSQWQVGDVIVERVWIPLPLPEGHGVTVGLYGAAPGSRLPVTRYDGSRTGEPNAVRVR